MWHARSSTNLIGEGCLSNFVIALSSITLKNCDFTIFHSQSRYNFKFFLKISHYICILPSFVFWRRDKLQNCKIKSFVTGYVSHFHIVGRHKASFTLWQLRWLERMRERERERETERERRSLLWRYRESTRLLSFGVNHACASPARYRVRTTCNNHESFSFRQVIVEKGLRSLTGERHSHCMPYLNCPRAIITRGKTEEMNTCFDP